MQNNDKSALKCFGIFLSNKICLCHLNVHKKLSITVVKWSACDHLVAVESISYLNTGEHHVTTGTSYYDRCAQLFMQIHFSIFKPILPSHSISLFKCLYLLKKHVPFIFSCEKAKEGWLSRSIRSVMSFPFRPIPLQVES